MKKRKKIRSEEEEEGEGEGEEGGSEGDGKKKKRERGIGSDNRRKGETKEERKRPDLDYVLFSLFSSLSFLLQSFLPQCLHLPPPHPPFKICGSVLYLHSSF